MVDLFSFDHDLGEFVSVGTGTVSEDGSVITSDPGVGIRKSGWGWGLTPPPPVTEAENDPCDQAAEDTANLAQDFAATNPNAVPFTSIQSCIASSVCDRAKPGGPDFQHNTWAETLIPKFVNRFLDGVDDPTSPWEELLVECAGLIFAGKDRCAAKMAELHIKKDMTDALLSMKELKEDKLVQKACGTQSDWDLVFTDIETCINNEPALSFAGRFFSPNRIAKFRKEVRDNCQATLGEQDG